MRYLPTINLWADGIQTAMANGQLKLQPGQWVRCGETGERARYAGTSKGGALYVAHHNGSNQARHERFKDLLEALRKRH